MLAAWARMAVPPGSSLPSLVAIDQFIAVGPAHGFFSPCGDVFAIGKLGQVGCNAPVIPFVDRTIVEHLREFFPADGFPWAEGIVLIAVHNAGALCPYHGFGLLIAGFDIRKT